MTKQIILLFFIILVLVGCSRFNNRISSEDVESSNIKNETKISIEEIKKNYIEEEILNIKQINENIVLVESQIETFANRFDIYNLDTGDKDTLPTMPEYVTLHSIENENYLIFLSSGKNSETNIGTFPNFIRCIRVKEEPNSENDFIAIREELVCDIGESISSGSKTCSNLSNGIVTMDSLQVVFEPIKGKESVFFAATTDIPPTKVHYDESSHLVYIDIEVEEMSENFNNAIESCKNENIKKISVTRKGNITRLILDIEDNVKTYKVRKKRMANSIFFEIYFGF